MRGLQVMAPHEINISDVVPDSMTDGLVRVRVQRVGLCGTDFSLVQGTLGLNTYPITPGHEVTGIVIESLHPNYAVGDQVVLDPLINCGDCWACQCGQPQWCSQVGVIGVVTPGGLRDEIVLPGKHWVPVSGQRAPEDYVLVEPAHVVDTALQAPSIRVAKTLLLIGSGALGLMFMGVLRSRFPDLKIWVYDEVPERLVHAGALGGEPWPGIGKGMMVDVVIDGVGATNSLALAVDAVRPGGQVIVYGVPKLDTSIPAAGALFQKNVAISFSRLYTHDFSGAVALIEDGVISGRSFISDIISFDDAPLFLSGERWRAATRWGKTIISLE